MNDHSTVKAVIIPQIIKLISNKYKLTLEAAMDSFYCSKTCAALADDETNLYSQSALYIFSLYELEQSKNKLSNPD